MAEIIYTNKHKLPEAFVRAALNDPYDNGGSDFSATSLAQPPRASALLYSSKTSPVVDVSSRVASIIGQGSHKIAERAARPGVDISEKRYFGKFNVGGIVYMVSAAVDLYEGDTQTLYDWKTTKAYAFSVKAGSGKKPEWIEQMNIGAELMRQNGHDVKALKIIAMLKDWREDQAGTGGMPHSEVVCVELPLWEPGQAKDHIESRIRLHVEARKNLPECTGKENWGGRRCERWCDASSICEQYQKTLIDEEF